MTTRRERVWLECCPGVAHPAVVIGTTILPWMVKVIARDFSGNVFKCWAHKRHCVERVR